MSLAGQMDDSPEKVRTYRDIGSAYSKSLIEKASFYFHKAIRLAKKINEERYLYSSYSQLAILYNKSGLADSTNYYLELSKGALSVKGADYDPTGYYQAATLIYRDRNEFEKSINAANENIKYLEKSGGNKANIAGAYHNLSTIYLRKKDFRKAADSDFKALELFTQINNEAGIAVCQNNLGIIFNELGQYKDSKNYFLKSYEYKKKKNDKRGMINSLTNLSSSYFGLNDFEQALNYNKKAHQLNKELKIPENDINFHWQNGKIYLGMKDTIASVSSFKTAIKLAKELGDKVIVNEISSEFDKISEVKSKELNLSDLEANLKQAETEFDSLNISKNLKSLIDYHTKHNNFKKAFEFQQRFYEIEKARFGPEVLEKMKHLESQFELERKETAIQLLEKNKEISQNKIQNQKMGLYVLIAAIILLLIITYLYFNRNKIIQENKRQKELNNIRNGIARDLHDDIGSTLSSIQIISNIIGKKETENPELSQSVNHIYELTDKVANGIREIVWSTNPDNDKLSSIIDRMHKYAAELLGPAEISYSFDQKLENPNLMINPAVRKNVLMIFKEAVNNARKYSDCTAVKVNIKQTKKNLVLKITDNGNGFDLETVKRGNGLNNIESRAGEINSKIEIQTKKGEGTMISLLIPILNKSSF